MAVITGRGGSVKLGANVVAEIDNWSLTVDYDSAKTTKFGDSWSSKVPTIKNWNGKASGRFDVTDTNGQMALQSSLLNSTLVSPTFSIDGTHGYSGQAWVKMDVKAAADSTVDVDFTFEGNGPCAYN